MLASLKVSSMTCKCIITDQSLMQREDPMELNFESLEMKRTNRYILNEYMRKMGSFV